MEQINLHDDTLSSLSQNYGEVSSVSTTGKQSNNVKVPLQGLHTIYQLIKTCGFYSSQLCSIIIPKSFSKADNVGWLSN